MISVAMILKKLADEHNLSVLVKFSTLIFGKQPD
jgi:phage protein D